VLHKGGFAALVKLSVYVDDELIGSFFPLIGFDSPRTPDGFKRDYSLSAWRPDRGCSTFDQKHRRHASIAATLAMRPICVLPPCK
jgi:hypothetical protein